MHQARELARAFSGRKVGMSKYLPDEEREYRETSRGRKKESIQNGRDYRSLSISPPRSQAFTKGRNIAMGLDAKHDGEIERQTMTTFGLGFRGFKPFDVTLKYKKKTSYGLQVDVDEEEEPNNNNKRSGQKPRTNDKQQDRLHVTITACTSYLFEIEMDELEDAETILFIEYQPSSCDKVSESLRFSSGRAGADDVLVFRKARFAKKVDSDRVKVRADCTVFVLID